MADDKKTDVKVPAPSQAPFRPPGRWPRIPDSPSKWDIPIPPSPQSDHGVDDGETRDTGPQIRPRDE